MTLHRNARETHIYIDGSGSFSHGGGANEKEKTPLAYALKAAEKEIANNPSAVYAAVWGDKVGDTIHFSSQTPRIIMRALVAGLQEIRGLQTGTDFNAALTSFSHVATGPVPKNLIIISDGDVVAGGNRQIEEATRNLTKTLRSQPNVDIYLVTTAAPSYNDQQELTVNKIVTSLPDSLKSRVKSIFCEKPENLGKALHGIKEGKYDAPAATQANEDLANLRTAFSSVRQQMEKLEQRLNATVPAVPTNSFEIK